MAPITPDQPGVHDPGPGRRLGVDVGTVRIGVALSGTDATLAMPLETIKRETGFKDRDKSDIERLITLITDNNVVEVIVGLGRCRGDSPILARRTNELSAQDTTPVSTTTPRTVKS